MFQRLALLIAFLAVAAVAVAQPVTQQQAQDSDRIMQQIEKVDILNQLLPIAMNKDQLNAILPAVEKARQKAKDLQAKEASELAEVDDETAKAVKDGTGKGDMPSKDLIHKLYALLIKMDADRTVLIEQNVDLVYDAVDKALNAGQKKAMANSLDPKYFGGKIDREKMSQEDLMRLFIQQIFLDPLGYEVLVEMDK